MNRAKHSMHWQTCTALMLVTLTRLGTPAYAKIWNVKAPPDTPLDHEAWADILPAPGPSYAAVSTPNWWWEATQIDADGDGLLDDIRVKARHKVAPHAGEAAPNAVFPAAGMIFLDVVPPSAPAPAGLFAGFAGV